MTWIFKQWERKFNITIINMWKALVKHGKHTWANGDFSKDVNYKKSQAELLEIKTIKS